MENVLYKKLCNIDLLRRGWHLTRNEFRHDFVQDPIRNSDFAFSLEDNLQSILHALKNDQYSPKPLLKIDVPKSTLAVRPGSVISVEDRIVLFSIVDLICFRLDSKLPENVYSCRLKEGIREDSLFKEREILKFPFLKKGTIRRRIDLTEPWYELWPKFYEKTYRTYKKGGYNYLTITDIAAYYENINIPLLRDSILLRYFPKEQKIINLLCNILESWTWPTRHGIMVPRGIPQAGDVCNFLGNIYLLPLDEELIKFSKRKDVKYYRYLDDVKILSKKKADAIEALFLMNEVLRSLHLNIQGSKTEIKEGKDVEEEIFDPRLDRLNNIIKDIQKTRPSNKVKRLELAKLLKRECKNIHNKKKIIKGKDLRLYRRIMTGFTLMRSSYLLDSVLNQISINPDRRLLGNAINYFVCLPKSSKKITTACLKFLSSGDILFPYQEAHLISCLRRLKEIPIGVVNYAKSCLNKKTNHWYVRVESARLISDTEISDKYLGVLRRRFSDESNLEVKRAMVKCLCQLERPKQRKLIRELVFDNHSRIAFLGRMLMTLYSDYNSAEAELSRLFRGFNEERLHEEFYKIEVIKNSGDPRILKQLKRRLNEKENSIKGDSLKGRAQKIIELLEKRLKEIELKQKSSG